MSQQDNLSDEEMITAWHGYAANQIGFVGDALRLLRDYQGQTLQEQQSEFGVSDKIFLRLQSMLMPRSQLFTNDAQRIAESCGLANPFAFVKAMVLARTLEHARAQPSVKEIYQAAFDAEDGLDEMPD